MPRSPTSGRRMDSVPDSPPAQGPHPAAPSPGEQSGRHSSDSPMTVLRAGGTEAGTARLARPAWRLTGVCLGGCGDARASGPGRGARGCGVFSLLLLL